MLNKCLVVFLITISLLSSAVKADNEQVTENGFKSLLDCMKTIPIDVTEFNGVSSSQVVLLSVLEEITQSKSSTKGLEVDYSKVYKLIESNCPKELEKVKRFSVQTTG